MTPQPNARHISEHVADLVDLPCFEAALLLEVSAIMLDLQDVEIATSTLDDGTTHIVVTGWDQGKRNFASLSVLVNGDSAVFGTSDVAGVIGETSALEILAHKLFISGKTSAPSVRWSEWARARWDEATAPVAP